MQPIFTTVNDDMDIVIIPDLSANLDGHPVLTHTYSIYRDPFHGSGKYIQKGERKLNPDRKNDPDYCGFITFEHPDKLFSYTPDGPITLSTDAVQELIEVITHYRDTPDLWAID
ncbi:MAG: hypothetical protein JST32_08350 [Bacteroidetes bacterium]|nr:hypothetical protein [Bacteroidota bacterium]